jgi:alpha-tubulin suppressor-like RCC1 family protein
MPKDDLNYKFTENGIVYDFYDVFVPAENFRQPALWTWGSSASGQFPSIFPLLGIPDGITRSNPVTTFAGGTNWKQVSVGYRHAAAIKNDGSLWTWGFNGDAELGINNTTSQSTPVTTFAGGNNWKQVAVGRGFSSAIKTDGTLWTWGANAAVLGINNTNDRKQTPVTTFVGGTTWKSIASGLSNVSAIKTDGSLWVWGYNAFGQLGVNDTSNRSIPTTTFAGGNDWKIVGGGYRHTTAIKNDGSLWVWGYNNTGQLGVNDTANKLIPVTTFAGGNTWKTIGNLNGATEATAAIKTDGTLWVWGQGRRIGVNNGSNIVTPVTTFAGGTNWKSASIGRSNMAAIKTDGSLWVTGETTYLYGNNNNQISYTPVTAAGGTSNWKQVSLSPGVAEFIAAIKYSPDP